MLKYTEAVVGFSEVPGEIALCINISGCPIHCEGCHSPHLWGDKGEELKPVVLSNLIAKNNGITCIAFMGGNADVDAVMQLAKWVKNNTELKTCWYSGRGLAEVQIDFKALDYIKTGPYIKELGGLDSPTTNQSFFKIKHEAEGKQPPHHLIDITYKFRNNETSNKNKSAD